MKIFYSKLKKKSIYDEGNRVSFETKDRIVKNSSELGLNDIKYPFAYREKNIYFMLHRNFITIQEYETSTEKNYYRCLYKKYDESKGDKITDENGGIIENGNLFRNCKVIYDKDSI